MTTAPTGAACIVSAAAGSCAAAGGCETDEAASFCLAFRRAAARELSSSLSSSLGSLSRSFELLPSPSSSLPPPFCCAPLFATCCGGEVTDLSGTPSLNIFSWREARRALSSTSRSHECSEPRVTPLNRLLPPGVSGEEAAGAFADGDAVEVEVDDASRTTSRMLLKSSGLPGRRLHHILLLVIAAFFAAGKAAAGAPPLASSESAKLERSSSFCSTCSFGHAWLPLLLADACTSSALAGAGDGAGAGAAGAVDGGKTAGLAVGAASSAG